MGMGKTYEKVHQRWLWAVNICTARRGTLLWLLDTIAAATVTVVCRVNKTYTTLLYLMPANRELLLLFDWVVKFDWDFKWVTTRETGTYRWR